MAQLFHIFEELSSTFEKTMKSTGAISLLCIFDFEFELTC